jgi:hypothetical protein
MLLLGVLDQLTAELYEKRPQLKIQRLKTFPGRLGTPENMANVALFWQVTLRLYHWETIPEGAMATL